MIDQTTSPLVLTKLRVPAARVRDLPRARLIERMAAEGAGLVLVCAPAGYGKTTLLVEWARALRQAGAAVAWYALDPGDDDPILFHAYLVASLIQALGPVPELAQVANLLRSSPELDPRRILPTVINAIVASERECVLVLDDYHLVSAPAVHAALAYLLDHLPDNLRIAIGSRAAPPLPLARLRARGRLLEIRTAGLRLTGEETAQFLNEVMRLDLPPEMVAALKTRTEGWVAGLQLAALSLAGRPDKERYIAKEDFVSSFSGSHRYLVEYLLEEVIDRQPEAVQWFLLATSILERLCPALCDALLAACPPVSGAGEDSAALLRQIEHANLFLVALDDQDEWYRYHHLFRDFLQAQLMKSQPERAVALHRAASGWYAQHGFLREAVRHALLTRDWDFAAALVEQHSFTMLLHSEISTIYEWCSSFPEEVMQRHPLLCIHQCWALALCFRRAYRQRVEARLRQAEQAAAGEDRERQAEIMESAAILRTFLAMAPDPTADIHAQLAAAQEMLGHYPVGDPGQFSGLLLSGYAHLALHDAPAAQDCLEKAQQAAFRGGLFFGVVESTFHLARLMHSRGQLRRAAETCQQAQADLAGMLAHPAQEVPALGCLDIALGCVLLEQNQLAEAESRLRGGLDRIGWGTNPYYRLAGHLALFRLYEAQGKADEAMQYLDHLEAGWPDIAFFTQGLRLLRALRAAPVDAGALAEAARWAQSFTASPGEDAPPPGMGPLGAAEVYYLAYLTWARIQIALGSAESIWPSLNKQLALAESGGLTTRVIELLLLAALAHQASGSREHARALMEHALALAQPEGFVRVFDQGPALAALMAEAAEGDRFRDYAVQITQAIGPAAPALPATAFHPALSPTAPGSNALVEPLSERELEVLRLMARGASNQAIAETLVIAVGTVKSHINHILGKFDAHNRTEAVVRAREMGVI